MKKLIAIGMLFVFVILVGGFFLLRYVTPEDPIYEYKGKLVANQYEWGLASIISTTWYFEDGKAFKVDGEMPLEIEETYEIFWKKG